MPNIRKGSLSGLLFIAIGGTFASLSALNHPLGTLSSMGRGFFPLLVGLLLVGIGCLSVWQEWKVELSDDEIFSLDAKPLTVVVASVVTFGLLLPSAGLYLTILAAVLVASLADRELGPGPALVLALGLAVATHLAFVVGLGLPMRIAPAALGL